jgi:hypothetical protein
MSGEVMHIIVLVGKALGKWHLERNIKNNLRK